MDYSQLYGNKLGESYFFVPIVDLGHVEFAYFSRKSRQRELEKKSERKILVNKIYQMQGGSAKALRQELNKRGIDELRELVGES